jgi:hypothetical protein
MIHYFWALRDRHDLKASESVDISDCRSIVLTLGPYRNLTTLTAAVCFLHPNCQVLNHAGARILGNQNLDFLSDFSVERLDRFARYAIHISTKGAKGGYGGSITHSHAFNAKHAMAEAFQKSGGELLKSEITCLYWKESLRTTDAIRKNILHLDDMLRADGRLRFLLPIRNPMDCATSNFNTGRITHFTGLTKKSSKTDVMRAVLDEIFWFGGLQRDYPDRFFHFFEHEISKDMLRRLGSFLELEEDSGWLDNALSVMKIKKRYEHDDDLISNYRRFVENRSVEFPDLCTGLLHFLE